MQFMQLLCLYSGWLNLARSKKRTCFLCFSMSGIMSVILVALSGCTSMPSCDDATDGACSTCIAPLADCNHDAEDGCEANLLVDVNHCGNCDKICPGVTTQSALCRNGVCGTCPPSRRDCNGLGADGCEAEITTDPKQCGACGVLCAPVPNAVVGCLNGVCTIAHCAAGFADCNGNATDGCETDTSTDLLNCGNCRNACPSLFGGTVGCQGGTCVVTACGAGFASCGNGTPISACETNTHTDVYNCGGCGTRCPATVGANTARACVMGTCTSAPCTAPFADCNGDAIDGCEIDTNRDPVHCGACNNVCQVLPNAGSTCLAGKCILTRCAADFGDCNGSVFDGCETNLLTDPIHCGACNVSCTLTANAASFACIKGQCEVSDCQPGYSDCDSLFNNGCEVNLTNDVGNCGACGSACPKTPHAMPRCTASVCWLTDRCDAGFANCDGNVLNGCEADLNNDSQNCGACNMPCSAGSFCSAGKCQLIR